MIRLIKMLNLPHCKSKWDQGHPSNPIQVTGKSQTL